MGIRNHVHVRHGMPYCFKKEWKATVQFRVLNDIFGEGTISERAFCSISISWYHRTSQDEIDFRILMIWLFWWLLKRIKVALIGFWLRISTSTSQRLLIFYESSTRCWNSTSGRIGPFEYKKTSTCTLKLFYCKCTSSKIVKFTVFSGV